MTDSLLDFFRKQIRKTINSLLMPVLSGSLMSFWRFLYLIMSVYLTTLVQSQNKYDVYESELVAGIFNFLNFFFNITLALYVTCGLYRWHLLISRIGTGILIMKLIDCFRILRVQIKCLIFWVLWWLSNIQCSCLKCRITKKIDLQMQMDHIKFL